MTREDILNTPAYWTQLIQLQLHDCVHSYIEEMDMTQAAFAEKIGVSKGYISQILNGNYDHKLSKLVELALACDCVPAFSFQPRQRARQVIESVYQGESRWTPVNYSHVSNREIRYSEPISQCHFTTTSSIPNPAA